MSLFSLKRDSSSRIVTCVFIFFHVMKSCHTEENPEMPSTQELAVKLDDLKICANDKRTCVTDIRHCGPRGPVSNDLLNISCYLLPTEYNFRIPYTQCFWSHKYNINAESMYSLIFSKTKDQLNGMESWSKPHKVVGDISIKAPVPTIISVSGSENSVHVKWKWNYWYDKCQVRYREVSTGKWIQISESVSVGEEKKEEVSHTIEGLKPSSSYDIAVSCTHYFNEGPWSDWSSEITVSTQESAPSRPPDVFYNVKKVNKAGLHELMLMWKTLSADDANEHILGYQVSYRQQMHPVRTINTTSLKIVFEVAEEVLEVAVMAYNTAGGSPYSHLTIDPHLCQTLPPVRSLWVYSEDNMLILQWDVGHISLPVNEVAIETITNDIKHSSSSHWKQVNGSSRSATLQADLQLGKTYRINVYPISYNLCGPPESIDANQNGALLGAARLHIEGVSTHAVTVQWEWQRQQTEMDTRVRHYQVLLMMGNMQIDSLPVWPDVRQHTFFKLRASTAYSVHLVVETPHDNISREIIPIKTKEFESNETILFSVCGIFLLILCIGIVFILHKHVYNAYYSPNIANPAASVTGQWLLEFQHQNDCVKKTLQMEEFMVTDQEISVIKLADEEPYCSRTAASSIVPANPSPVNLSQPREYDGTATARLLPGFPVAARPVFLYYGYCSNGTREGLCHNILLVGQNA
ncbi:hypothetical protein DPEC_G00258210 [Dallia pectoralis]|uniref:Uncharacterized protein n=1 Tax=Dallia pectoralis TaxID=75939 RepID=A0ACC2FQZ6_DALPE|nr:hypothetical protein DPEC_G00258210 [Dallia pectoralis]